jgi:hypothetical protein
MDPSSVDARVRLAAFDFLASQTAVSDGILPRTLLAQGFLFEGTRVPLIGPQGIFKPAVLSDVPLSITAVPAVPGRPRPYDDAWGGEGLILYRYRGTDPQHRDNVGLRLAMARRTPLVYLHGIVPGEYMPVWPVYVVGDDPSASPSTSRRMKPRRRSTSAATAPSPRRAAGTSRQPYSAAYTSSPSACGSSAPTRSAARSAACATVSCWTRRTSCPTPTLAASRSSPTAWRSAPFTTPPSTTTSSASGPT